MASLAKHAVQAFNKEKPHSSISEWIEILTSSNHEVEAYDGVPELVDSINLQAEGTTEASRAIRKKLKHGDTHQQLRALVILKALVENCGPKFQTSFANDRMTDAIRHLPTDLRTSPAVNKKLFVVLASWKHQFQGDPKMKHVASLYDQCKQAQRAPKLPEIALIEEEKERAYKEEKKREKKQNEKAIEEERARLKEERARRLKETRRSKRKPFNFEKEKPEVLACIANASQASSNLVNAIILVNREQEPIEANPRVQECLSAAKDVRNHLVRYIQLVEDEELIGTLLETNERIIQALEMYDQNLIPDTIDTGIETQLSRTTLSDGNVSVSEVNKLQAKQRAAVVRAQRSTRAPADNSNIHPDLHDLDFGAIGSDASGLPSPLRPTSPDSPLSGELPGRGSLSDYSDYDSSDEETHYRNMHSSGPASPVSGKGKARGEVYKSVTDEDLTGEEAVRRQALLDDSDPFADPEVVAG